MLQKFLLKKLLLKIEELGVGPTNHFFGSHCFWFYDGKIYMI